MDPSLVSLVLLACAIVHYSSKRFLSVIQTERQTLVSDDDDDDEYTTSQDISLRQACMFPFIASLSLTVMYLLIQSRLQVLVTVYIVVAHASSMYLAIVPYVAKVSKRPLVVSWTFVGGIIVLWLLSGHWLLNNFMGACACVSIMMALRLPSLKIAAVILWCLFVYDIFWVFYSSTLFGESVMVKVATTEHDNPVHQLSSRMHINLGAAETLQMPLKFIIPAVFESGRNFFLGFGDVVLPGMMTCLFIVKDNDIRHVPRAKAPPRHSYYVLSFVGYSVGLVAAVFFASTFQVAQPALLYIVPAMFVPVVVQAKQRRELAFLWDKTPEEVEDMDSTELLGRAL